MTDPKEKHFRVNRVSIHTPTKGVTAGTESVKGFGHVSIHTPTKGVTFDDTSNNYKSAVSIHTPTKGVTLQPIVEPLAQLCFNPHTHEGCDWRIA